MQQLFVHYTTWFYLCGTMVLAHNGLQAQLPRDNDTYRPLSIDYESEEIIGFIKAGYPEKNQNSQQKTC